MITFVKAKATYICFHSKNISIYAILNYQSFKDTLSNDILSFKKVGPGLQMVTSE